MQNSIPDASRASDRQGPFQQLRSEILHIAMQQIEVLYQSENFDRSNRPKSILPIFIEFLSIVVLAKFHRVFSLFPGRAPLAVKIGSSLSIFSTISSICWIE